MNAPPRVIWMPPNATGHPIAQHLEGCEAWVQKSDYDKLRGELDGALLDKGLSEVMKSQLNARIQNCEAALEERDQQLMVAQTKLSEAERLLAMALDAMTSLDGTRRTESKLQDAIKEIEGSKP